jgi:hypothetical protein
MAKKVRRARLSATQTYVPTATAPGSQTAAPKTSIAAPRAVNFSEEYRYIISDLKTIAILAASILGGLVVLSFFIK